MNFKRILLTAGAVIIVIIAFNLDLIAYGWMQGKGQLQIIKDARSVESFLEDPNIPDSLKSKLRLLEDIKTYALALGLKVNESYTKVYDQQGKPILWNVSACAPYAFDSYEWSFPILGSVSYKGFFNKAAADALVERLKKDGYDVNIRSVGAWSTLGWLNDPLLSNQLFRSHGALSETVFHELTHATVFFSDSLAFNENLASFVGEKAAEAFLIEKYGDSSIYLMEYLADENDARLFRNHLLLGKERLDSLYRSFGRELPDSTKSKMKAMTMAEIVANLDTLPFQNRRYVQIFSSGRQLNNAYLMGFNRYYSQQDQLQELLFQHDDDLKSLIASIKELAN